MDREANILIVDDSQTIQEYIKQALEQAADFSGRIFKASNGREALEILRHHKVDLVLCDVVMPEMDGFMFLERMKAIPKYSDIPVVMLTAEESVEKKVHGLDSGASDYLVKPFNESELIARVRVQLKVKYLQDELKKANKRYRRLSITDHLTRLYNRRYFLDMLKNEFARSERYKIPISIIMVDIDHFKRINDDFGHIQGDRLLSELSALLKKNLRRHDIIARYGGEEFVILIPMVSEKEAREAAEKLRQIIENHRFRGVEERRITVSMGMCSYPADGIDNIDELIARADSCLYSAKRTGRNRVVVYSKTRSRSHQIP